jgi:ribonuclease-3
MTIAEHLFRACPEQDEGELTKMKSCVVCGPVLTRAAQRLGLGEYARVDEGVSARGLPPSLLSDLFEALVGAIYLDGGQEEARRFIFAALEGEIQDVVAGRVASDAKSLLQLHAHRELGCDPLYRILEETGPAHRKQFRAAVNVAGADYCSDWAATKAAAEQDAAAVALRALGLR